MRAFIIYTTSTGEIRNYIEQDDISDAPTGPAGTSTMEVTVGLAASLYYVPSGVLTARPYLSSVATWDSTTLTANGVDTVTLGSGLPATTTYTITPLSDNGVDVVTGSVTDGSLTITTDAVGPFKVELDGIFPYLTDVEVITGE